MRFVNWYSYLFAKRLSILLNDGHQKRSVYYFSFQIILGGLVKNIILFSLAILVGAFIPTLIIATIFGTLRMIAGGYHMDTYGRCLFVSLMLFLVSASAAQYTNPYWNISAMLVLIIFTFIFGLYALIRYAPKDTPHKPITEPAEIRKFKILSLTYLFLLSAAGLVLVYYKLNMYALSLCFGAFLELYTLTPMGHKFFDFIKGMTIKSRHKVSL